MLNKKIVYYYKRANYNLTLGKVYEVIGETADFYIIKNDFNQRVYQKKNKFIDETDFLEVVNNYLEFDKNIINIKDLKNKAVSVSIKIS